MLKTMFSRIATAIHILHVTLSRELEQPQYVMATRAVHPYAGNVSCSEPSLARIYRRSLIYNIGEWVEGSPYCEVRFPRWGCRCLTAEERRRFNGRTVAINGTARYQIKL